MLINDSIIRTRYREGFEREVMMEPGTPYLVQDPAAADVERVREGPPDPDRRLVVELPAARAQPEHGRADRAAHAHDPRRADGLLRSPVSVAGGAARYSGVRSSAQ